MEKSSGRRKVDPGPTSAQLATNLRQLRDGAGLTLNQLSERLAVIGRPILASGLSKIEQGQRSVDVDDLVALAIALEVSPNRLLLPSSASEEDELALTDGFRASESMAWRWAAGEAPLPTSEQDAYRFATVNRPHDPHSRLTDEEIRTLGESGNLDTLAEGYRQARDAGLSDETIRAYFTEVRRADYLNRFRAKKAH